MAAEQARSRLNRGLTKIVVDDPCENREFTPEDRRRMTTAWYSSRWGVRPAPLSIEISEEVLRETSREVARAIEKEIMKTPFMNVGGA